MNANLWPESYPEIFERANGYWRCRMYLDAGIEYLKAASLAPNEEDRTIMLEFAWQSEERHHGRVSELEIDEPGACR